LDFLPRFQLWLVLLAQLNLFFAKNETLIKLFNWMCRRVSGIVFAWVRRAKETNKKINIKI
jgi:hypothetical protein